MTIYPLDTVRNARTRSDVEVVLESVRTDILQHPWSDTDEGNQDEVLEAFDRSRHRLNVIGSMLQDLTGSSGADVGCGLGFTTEMLRRIGLCVTPTERPDDAATPSVVSGPILSYDIGRTRPPIPQGSLDFLVFSEVLEHVNRSPVPILRELRGMLRSDGRLVLTTPNVARRSHIEALVAGENFLEPFDEAMPFDRAATDWIEHIREYSVREVVDAVEGAGFGIDEVAMATWGSVDTDLLPNPYANDIIVVRATA